MLDSDNINFDSLKRLFDRLENLSYIHPEEIPSLDLYMDQVTTFMEEHLESSKRYESDKILTKTMINNYAKNKLLPAPVKKKYSRDHIVFLIFIYYMKNVMSINDIQTLMTPLTEQYFGSQGDLSLKDIYAEIIHHLTQDQDGFLEHVQNEFASTETLFTHFPDTVSKEEKEKLRRFAFICNLAFDVYMKKMMIEMMIDDMAAEQTSSKSFSKRKSDASAKAEKKADRKK